MRGAVRIARLKNPKSEIRTKSEARNPKGVAVAGPLFVMSAAEGSPGGVEGSRDGTVSLRTPTLPSPGVPGEEEAQLLSAVSALPPAWYAIGMSGGADSTSLFFLLRRYRPD